MAHFFAISTLDKELVGCSEKQLNWLEYEPYQISELFVLIRAGHIVNSMIELTQSSWDDNLDFHVITKEDIPKIIKALKGIEKEPWHDQEDIDGLISFLEKQEEEFDFDGPHILAMNWDD